MVYERSGNPFFDLHTDVIKDPLAEYIKPSEVNRIVKALDVLGYDVEFIDGPRHLLQDISKLKKRVKLLFNKSLGIKGLEKKNPVPTIAHLFQIPVVGASSYGLTLGRHKYHVNRLLHGIGITVPHSVICYPGEIPSSTLTYPVIVKPNNESNSLGITANSIFYDSHGLVDTVAELHKKFNQPVVIEEYIRGPEWHVAIIGNKPNTQALGCVEAVKNGSPIVNSVKTRADNVLRRIQYFQVAPSPLVREALDTAKKIHDMTECYDYSRCDFRIGTGSELVCIEITPHPDLGEDSCFVPAALQAIENYELMIDRILGATITRYGITTQENLRVELNNPINH